MPSTCPALILLSALNLLLLFVNSVHISKPEGGETLKRKKTDKGQEIVEQRARSLERMKYEPSAQHCSALTQRDGFPFPRGHKETGTDPRPGSLAYLSFTRETSHETTLGIEWVKMDVLRFERFSRLIAFPIILQKFWWDFYKGPIENQKFGRCHFIEKE